MSQENVEIVRRMFKPSCTAWSAATPGPRSMPATLGAACPQGFRAGYRKYPRDAGLSAPAKLNAPEPFVEWEDTNRGQGLCSIDEPG